MVTSGQQARWTKFLASIGSLNLPCPLRSSRNLYVWALSRPLIRWNDWSLSVWMTLVDCSWWHNNLHQMASLLSPISLLAAPSMATLGVLDAVHPPGLVYSEFWDEEVLTFYALPAVPGPHCPFVAAAEGLSRKVKLPASEPRPNPPQFADSHMTHCKSCLTHYKFTVTQWTEFSITDKHMRQCTICAYVCLTLSCRTWIQRHFKTSYRAKFDKSD
jgi:hypothetical protein